MDFKNIPNILTISRIIVVPIIVLSFYFDDKIFAHRIGALLFAYASFTDFLDGYLARKFDIGSNFGRMMDPIADKLLVMSILFMLAACRKVEIFPCLLILTREILVSGLREFLAELKVTVRVSNLAKVKTVMQMFSLFVLMLGSKGSGIASMDLIGKTSLWIAAILTIITGYSYFHASKEYFLED